MRTRSVAIVAAHFVPSNLAAVHRARLWSLHLREFGWEPIIVTTHWKYYEEPPEFELENLVPGDLKVVRTKAIPAKPIRIVGDIGIRAFYWHYHELIRLAQSKEIDFVHVTIPSHFSAPLGRLVKRRTGVPYGIDYIDPWVHEFPGSERPLSKAGVSARLAKWLEPWAVKEASLITGINARYYRGMLERNPCVAQRAILAEMPYGGSEYDHDYVRHNPRPLKLFEPYSKKFNLIYAGAMLPKAYSVLDRLLEAVALLRQKSPRLANDLHLHFVGTGKSPTDPAGFNIRPRLKRSELSKYVSEYPQRLPYLDVLSHLDAASGVLVIGSTEPHYSPSKIFQAVMSRRPVFALLNEQSTAVSILRATGAAWIVTFSETTLPKPQTIAEALEQFISGKNYSGDRINWGSLNKWSARESARALAAALDEACQNVAI